MSFCSLWSPQSVPLFSKPSHGHNPLRSHFRASADVPGFLSADWLESRRKRPFGPRLNFTAEEAVQYQLDALMFNDQPRQDYGIEVTYWRDVVEYNMKQDHYKQRGWIRGVRPGEEEVFQFTMVQSWWFMGRLLAGRISTS